MTQGLMKKTTIWTNVLRKRGNSQLLIQNDVYLIVWIYIIFTLTDIGLTVKSFFDYK